MIAWNPEFSSPSSRGPAAGRMSKQNIPEEAVSVEPQGQDQTSVAMTVENAEGVIQQNIGLLLQHGYQREAEKIRLQFFRLLEIDDPSQRKQETLNLAQATLVKVQTIHEGE